MNEPKATRFQRRRRRARVGAWLSASGALAVVALSPLGAWLARGAALLAALLPTAFAPVGTLVLFTLTLVLIWEAAALPALIYTALRVEPDFQGAGKTAGAVIAAEVRAAAMAFPVAVGVAGVVQVSAWLAPGLWWLVSSFFASLGLAAALRLGPVLLGRVGAVRPLQGGTLRSTVAAVVKASNVPVSGIFEWAVGPNVGASALVAGVGPARRVLVSSALVRQWSDDEIAVVVAHELGHHAHHDLSRASGLAAVILCAGFWAADLAIGVLGNRTGNTGAADLAALPFIVLIVALVWLVSTPIRLAQSRGHERRADAFALACTGRVEAFAAVVRRLSAERLAEDQPSNLTTWLFHRHPSVADRLAVSEGFRRDLGARG
jgi:STE24 endopeptidase